MNKLNLIILLLLMGLTQPLWAQQEIIASYADSTKTRTYCLYPSTLRMLDPTRSPEFYEVVNNIEKLVIYTLDSTAAADKSYRKMLAEYQALGYDEYIAMYGGQNQLMLYGREKKDNGNFVGIFRMGDNLQAYYMDGTVGWEKIPVLIRKIQDGDMLDIFSLNTKKSGHNPHD